jgi:methylmalonyl-CoA/ethylmalonyl-CoA epimerase
MTQRLQHLHHLGVAVRSIAQGRQFVERSFPVTDSLGPIWDPGLKAELLLLSIDGTTAIELVAGPAVEKVLARGVVLYHMCYEVDDLKLALADLRAAGGLVVIPPTPAVLFQGRLVAFVHSPIGLVELLERSHEKMQP